MALIFAAALAAGNLSAADAKPGFQPKPASEYANKQTSEQVTIAAQPYTTDDQTKEPFGKLNPWRYNVLPVLVVIQNDSPNAIKVDHIRFQYQLPDNSKVDATVASDVKYAKGPSKPKASVAPMGVKIGKTKNPLDAFEIESRAFVAKIIPPGQTASGFVYFETDVDSAAASLYISGLTNAATGKELFYFDIPLSAK